MKENSMSAGNRSLRRRGARTVTAVVGLAALAATTAACSAGSLSPAAHTRTAPVAKSTLKDDFSTSSSATGRVGSPLNVKIGTTDPDARITESGALPAGITFRSQVGAGATLTGSPTAGSGGVYRLALEADSPAGRSAQTLALTIDEGPAFTGSVHIVTWALKYNHTPITTKGYPPAKITESGTLPSGMVFRDNGDGTAQIDGNPTLLGSTGASSVTITAQNASGQTSETIEVTAIDGKSIFDLIFDII
jgi:hypothetical protein